MYRVNVEILWKTKKIRHLFITMNSSLLGVLIGAGISLIIGGVSYWSAKQNLQLQLDHQEILEKGKLKITKLEEINSLVHERLYESKKYVDKMNLFKAANAKMETANVIETGDDFIFPFMRIHSLVEMYVPELIKNSSDLNKLASDLQAFALGRLEASRFNDKFHETFKLFITEAQNFSQKVSRAAYQYTEIKNLNGSEVKEKYVLEGNK